MSCDLFEIDGTIMIHRECQVQIKDFVRGAPASEAKSCQYHEAYLHEQSELFVAA